MIFSLIYIVACLFSDEVSFDIWYMFGAILLDLLIGYPTFRITLKRGEKWALQSGYGIQC